MLLYTRVLTTTSCISLCTFAAALVYVNLEMLWLKKLLIFLLGALPIVLLNFWIYKFEVKSVQSKNMGWLRVLSMSLWFFLLSAILMNTWVLHASFVSGKWASEEYLYLAWFILGVGLRGCIWAFYGAVLGFVLHCLRELYVRWIQN